MTPKRTCSIDFIGVGAPKCGTRWITQCLREHPALCVAQPDALDFFNHPMAFYRKEDKRPYDHAGIDSYCAHFRHCKPTQRKGEFSVYYLYDKEAPSLIKRHFPHAKILIVLRNPADRLYSHYLYAAEKRDFLSFDELIEKEKTFVGLSSYYEPVKRYRETFSKERVLVVLYEDMVRDPKNVMQTIYRFLEVDDSFVAPSLTRLINPTAPKTSFLKKTFYRAKRSVMRRACGKIIIAFLKRLGVARAMHDALQHAVAGASRKKKSYRAMNPATRERLTRFYRSERKKLEELLERDLSLWE